MLKEEAGRDILVLNSASIIQALLRSDLVDDIPMAIVPAMVGGGLRLSPTACPHRQGNWPSHDTCTRCRRAALPPFVGTAPVRSLLETGTDMRALGPPLRVHRAVGRAGEPATRAGPPTR